MKCLIVAHMVRADISTDLVWLSQFSMPFNQLCSGNNLFKNDLQTSMPGIAMSDLVGRAVLQLVHMLVLVGPPFSKVPLRLFDAIKLLSELA